MNVSSSQCLGFDGAWHLERSQPRDLFRYFDLSAPFLQQAHVAMVRFCAVQQVCVGGGPVTSDLVDLRNALAFHLVKLSRWWMIDFCPNLAVDVRAALFVTYVKAHVARSMEDDALFDLLTQQRDMRANDPAHILVLHQQARPEIGAQVMFGVDGRRAFRFAVGSPGQDPIWNGHGYPDYIGAWLASNRVASLMSGDAQGMRLWQRAACEFRWTQPWRRRAMIDMPDKPLAERYVEACGQADACETAFGARMFEAVLGQIAFALAREAFERRVPVSQVIGGAACAGRACDVAELVQARARAHVAAGIDPCVRPDFDAMLDAVSLGPG